MRTATSTDYFVRTPANCITLRSTGEARISGRSIPLAIDLRLNRQNYARSLALHIPSTSAAEVGAALQMLSGQLDAFSNLELGERNIIISVAPDVPNGAGIAIENGEMLRIVEVAPWIAEGRKIEARDFALSKIVIVYCDCDELSLDLGDAQRACEKIGFDPIFFGQRYLAEMISGETPAFFISYDARNRETIARPIAARLTSKGEPVWFDDFDLRPGDNLRQTIEDGLKKCRQCALLVTKELLTNDAWAKVEFDAIFAREVSEKRKIIVPVWVDVTRSEVEVFSLSLANKFAVVCTAEELQSEAGLERVAHAITMAKPDT